MRRSRLALFITAAIGLAAASGGAQTVTGTVVDAGNRSGLATAEVLLRDSVSRTLGRVLTDASGSFVLVAPRAGRFALHVARLGYDSLTTALFRLRDSETLGVTVTMAAQAVLLEPLTVVARARSIRQRELRDYYQRISRDSAWRDVRVFPREVLARYDSWTYAQFLQRAAPSVGAPGRYCSPLVFWDGVPNQPDPQMSIYNFEGFEFYPGFGPPDGSHRNPDACGVVLIWTRPFMQRPARDSSHH